MCPRLLTKQLLIQTTLADHGLKGADSDFIRQLAGNRHHSHLATDNPSELPVAGTFVALDDETVREQDIENLLEGADQAGQGIS